MKLHRKITGPCLSAALALLGTLTLAPAAALASPAAVSQTAGTAADSADASENPSLVRTLAPVPSVSPPASVGAKPASGQCGTSGPFYWYDLWEEVLAVAGGNMVNGNSVWQFPNTQQPDQRWYQDWFDNYGVCDTFRIMNSKTDASGRHYCLDVENGSGDPGARVQIWTCNDNLQQQWYWGSFKQGCTIAGCTYYTQLVNERSGLVLAVWGGRRNDTNVIQYLSMNSNDQYWLSF